MFWRQTGPTESQNLEGILHRVHQQITPAVSSYQIQFCCLSGRYPSMQQLQHNGVYLQTGSETASLSSWCHEEENSQTSLNFQSKWSLMWAECSLLIGWILSAASLAAVSGPWSHPAAQTWWSSITPSNVTWQQLRAPDTHQLQICPATGPFWPKLPSYRKDPNRNMWTETISALVLVQRVSYFHHNHNQNQRAELRFDFKYCWY